MQLFNGLTYGLIRMHELTSRSIHISVHVLVDISPANTISIQAQDQVLQTLIIQECHMHMELLSKTKSTRFNYCNLSSFD